MPKQKKYSVPKRKAILFRTMGRTGRPRFKKMEDVPAWGIVEVADVIHKDSLAVIRELERTGKKSAMVFDLATQQFFFFVNFGGQIQKVGGD